MTPLPPDKRQPPSASGFKVADVYYTLFRHKWKIILCALLGFGAAAGLYYIPTPTYVSEARLLVRYVVENRGFVGEGPEASMRSPDARGENVINSEIEILTSLDLAERVANEVGPDRIMEKLGGGNDSTRAAFYIRAHLEVTNPRRSNVLRVLFSHPDPEIARSVLKGIVDTYLKRHFEIHRAVGAMDEFLTTETSRITAQLNRTEEDLRRAKAKAGVVSIAESMQDNFRQIRQRKDELHASEAALARLQAKVSALGGIVSTNDSDTATATPVLPEPPADVLRQYKELSLRLEGLRQRLRDLAGNFTEANKFVMSVRSQISGLEEQQEKLEAEYPRLAVIPAIATPGSPSSPAYDTQLAIAEVNGLQEGIKTLKAQLETLHAEASRVNAMEIEITELQRRKDQLEKSLQMYSSGLEQSRVDSLLGNTKLDNIGVAQAPTPAVRDTSKIMKPVLGALVGGLAFGLALAFLTEMFLDQTVKRASDIENKLHLPVFLHIPRLRQAPKLLPQLPAPANGAPKLPEDAEAGSNGNGNGNGTLGVAHVPTEMPPWDENHPLRPYVEALRDRFIAQFEIDQNTRKP
ncbi:MAG: GumC family protein, partial [Limisphaerales bacterium]